MLSLYEYFIIQDTTNIFNLFKIFQLTSYPNITFFLRYNQKQKYWTGLLIFSGRWPRLMKLPQQSETNVAERIVVQI